MPKLKEPDAVKKQFVAEEIKVDTDERTLTAVISTGTVDRDGEVLLPGGAGLEPFLKNPVVLWAHDYSSPPIGKAQWIKKGRGRLTAKVEFAETEQAEEVYQLYKGGFLKAFSVGLIGKNSHAPTPDEIKKKPEWAEARRIIDQWELLEFSAVPVPANAEALAIAVKNADVQLSNDNKKAFGIEDEPEPEVYKATAMDADPEPTATIEDKPLIVIARHIPVTRHRPKQVIRLRRHISPEEVARGAQKKLRGQVIW